MTSGGTGHPASGSAAPRSATRKGGRVRSVASLDRAARSPLLIRSRSRGASLVEVDRPVEGLVLRRENDPFAAEADHHVVPSDANIPGDAAIDDGSGRA